uniref:Uncharacterized protein n=1 Tax=viral metagenome TaxID=1070528 RepID=A0A6C0JSY4_9ZZZZ
MQFQVGQYYTINYINYSGAEKMDVKVLDTKNPTLVENITDGTKHFIKNLPSNHTLYRAVTTTFKDGDKETIVHTPSSFETPYYINSITPMLSKCYTVTFMVNTTNVTFPNMTNYFVPKPTGGVTSGRHCIAIGICTTNSNGVSYVPPPVTYDNPQLVTRVANPFKPSELTDIMPLLSTDHQEVVKNAETAYPKSFTFTVEQRPEEEYTVITKTPTGFVHIFFKTTFLIPSIKTINDFFLSAKDVSHDTIPNDAQGWVERGHVEAFDMKQVNDTIAASNAISDKIIDLRNQIRQLEKEEEQVWQNNKIAQQYKEIYNYCTSTYSNIHVGSYPMIVLQSVLNSLEQQLGTRMFNDLDRLNENISRCKQLIADRLRYM